MPRTREGKKVSAVATEERPDTAADENVAALREWLRTQDQEETVAQYEAMIDRMYAGASPEYIAALKDAEIMSTADLVDFLGYKRHTRVFQLYTDLRELAEADQTPHPSAMPDHDATGGHRGARAIRGVMKGRVIHWALQSGRFWWNARTKQLVPQTGINHGGAPRQR
jgi:hypothetical protein